MRLIKSSEFGLEENALIFKEVTLGHNKRFIDRKGLEGKERHDFHFLTLKNLFENGDTHYFSYKTITSVVKTKLVVKIEYIVKYDSFIEYETSKGIKRGS